jgi:hypothetical protein
VLVPFEERIIYDSLLEPYALSFGPGIRRSLQESYRDAQEREGLITTLLPEGRSPAMVLADLQRRNARVLAAFQKELARSTMTFGTMEQHVETIGKFARFLLDEDPPRGLLELTGRDLERYIGVQGGRANPVSFRRFVRFLATTGRLEYTLAEDLMEALKQ